MKTHYNPETDKIEPIDTTDDIPEKSVHDPWSIHFGDPSKFSTIVLPKQAGTFWFTNAKDFGVSMKKKPNKFHRFMIKIFFGFVWQDQKEIELQNQHFLDTINKKSKIEPIEPK